MSLSSRIDDIEAKVDVYANKIDDVEEKLNVFKTNVDSEINNLNLRIAALEEQIKYLKPVTESIQKVRETVEGNTYFQKYP